MFEDFTERARKCFQLATKWARLKCSDFIGTEHVLLGLIEEGGGLAAKYLAKKGISLKQVDAAADKLIPPSTTSTVPLSAIPYSPRSIRVIELSGEAAAEMGAPVAATEHVLIALITENEGVAAQILRDLDVGVGAIDEIREILGLPLAKKKSSYREKADELLLKHAKRLTCKLLQEGRTDEASVVSDLASRVEGVD